MSLESKHVRGVGSKEQRMYEHIKQSAQRSGRYGRRAKEVAARMLAAGIRALLNRYKRVPNRGSAGS